MIGNFLIPGVPLKEPNKNNRSHVYNCYIKSRDYRFKSLLCIFITKHYGLHGICISHMRGNAGCLENRLKLLRLHRSPRLKVSYGTSAPNDIKEIPALYIKHSL